MMHDLPHFNPAIRDASELGGFVDFLSRCPSDSDRKQLVLDAYDRGALNEDETSLLISALMVEAA